MINYPEIQKRINAGLITSRKHPTLPLEILNYTQKVQFDKLWDKYTKMCRGLILDANHNIVARPFQKFFNLGETPETMIQNLPNEIPKITEKMDGSLGILYFDNFLPSIATRGAFESPQAAWATNWIRQKGLYSYDFMEGYTYLFEIICSESKNVVNYDFEGLVLIAVISNKDGKEDDDDVFNEAYRLNFKCPQAYQEKIEDIVEGLKTDKGTEHEGVVCKYSNGLRLKIKSDDYKRLHKILSGFSETNIWEALSQGKSLDSMAELVPDEFYQWIKDTEAKFLETKNKLMNEANEVAQKASILPIRKNQADYIMFYNKNKPRGFSGLVFNILDGKTELAEKSAWNMLKH